MSRHLFAFLLSELETLRVICGGEKCGRIIELTIDDLATRSVLKCPFCGEDFNPSGLSHSQKGPLGDFAAAVVALKSLSGLVGVEFVLPANAPAEATASKGGPR